MHTVELVLAVLVGMALPFILKVLLAVLWAALGGSLPEPVYESDITPGSWGPRAREEHLKRLSGRRPPMPASETSDWLDDLDELELRLDGCGRRVRLLHDDYLRFTLSLSGTQRADRRHQLQELARHVRRGITQVRLMRADAMGVGGNGSNSRPTDDNRNGDHFAAGAGADGPDACMLFPKAVTDPEARSSSATHSA